MEKHSKLHQSSGANWNGNEHGHKIVSQISASDMLHCSSHSFVLMDGLSMWQIFHHITQNTRARVRIYLCEYFFRVDCCHSQFLIFTHFYNVCLHDDNLSALDSCCDESVVNSQWQSEMSFDVLNSFKTHFEFLQGFRCSSCYNYRSLNEIVWKFLRKLDTPNDFWQ